MKIFAIIIIAGLCLIFPATVAMSAGVSAGDIKVTSTLKLPQRSFSRCCPKPDWWNDVTAPSIKTRKQLGKIWRSKKHSDYAKAKAFYTAILRFEGKDDDIVSTAISFYGYVDRAYPHKLEMLEYGVANFFDHKRSLDRYSGKVGDTSAGLVIKLAHRYLRKKRPKDAAAIISRMVRTREAEINQHQLERLSMKMVEALKAMGRNKEALDVVQYAISTYNGSWEKKLVMQKTELQKEQGPASFLSRLKLNYLALGGGLLLVLLFALLLLRGRSNSGSAVVRFGR